MQHFFIYITSITLLSVNVINSQDFSTPRSFTSSPFRHLSIDTSRPSTPYSDLGSPCSWRMSPLHFFSGSERPRSVSSVESGQISPIFHKKDRPALYTHIRNGDFKKVQDSIIAGENINGFIDEQNSRPVILAARHTHVGILERILREKPKLNKKDLYGKTALHWAARSQKPKAVQLLLEAGADKNIRTKFENETTLQIAQRHGNEEIIELLA